MPSIIIPASKSLTITNKIPNGNINEDTILVGFDGIYNYFSYLFFDISPIPSNVKISYAELVLFKTDNFYNDDRKIFDIYLLDDYFSTYTTYKNHPKINETIKTYFYPITSKVAATVKLTSFVSLWIKNKFLNTSIMLCGKNKNTLASFGSAICKDSYLIPFIKVFFTPICNDVCNDNPFCPFEKPTIKQIQVTGTVAPEGKYEAIVNLEVTRKCGHKDNYYVTDEYNNSSNKSSLHVDKTYNLAVIPKENPGDTENITFYGSYKL